MMTDGRISIALLALSLVSAAHAAAPPPRTELPIKEVDLSDGTRRHAVTVVIDGVQMDAGLDTGSTGLRVLAPGLPATPAGGAYAEYSYSSGLSIKGKIGHVNVQFGTVSATLPVHLIDKLGCTSQRPDCAGKKLTLADFGTPGGRSTRGGLSRHHVKKHVRIS